ncbi:phosphatidylinositol-specific phospholipase [Gallibacterium anatis]|nr:phosphatidylinositol-specific phospholipase [Gallibacterium anatis]KGQ56386.1 phosphatidylinositol-specific phospholipase [Gallibacterium anatis str. Avicor]
MQTFSLSDWLAECQPETQINRLLIPGTHDTMTASCQQRYYKTQTLTLLEQLQCGVRFLDLRLRKEMVAAHREWVSEISAEMIFDTLLEFLFQHPSEFIFVRIQNANEAKDDFMPYQMALHDKLSRYQSSFYHWQTEEQEFVFPSIAQVAGKLVAFECSPPQFKSHWYQQRQWALPWHENKWITLQDNWDGPMLNDKFEQIKQNVIQSREIKEKLYLNHISATNGELGYPDAYAKILNIRTMGLWQELQQHLIAGVQIYDYITSEISEAVIRCNFR